MGVVRVRIGHGDPTHGGVLEGVAADVCGESGGVGDVIHRAGGEVEGGNDGDLSRARRAFPADRNVVAAGTLLVPGLDVIGVSGHERAPCRGLARVFGPSPGGCPEVVAGD